MIDGELRITMADCLKCGHCVSGIRNWFSARDLDFRQFVRQGISVKDFTAEPDAYANKIVEQIHG
jgi:hypothetical protein